VRKTVPAKILPALAVVASLLAAAAPPAGAGERARAHLVGKPKTVATRAKQAKLRFAFTADAQGATFECSIDNLPFKACVSPKSYWLGEGRHTFKVRATVEETPGPVSTTKFRVGPAN
jgi:hypothetical protein